MATLRTRFLPWATALTRAGWAPLLVTLLVGFAALAPRVVGLADFLTTDEAYHWIGRTERFSAALAAGRWAETLQSGHPGVILMWLGSLGLLLERTWHGAGAAALPTVEHLAWLRLPVAVTHALLIGLGYQLLRRLVTPGLALVGALLWATTPYLVAHGRLLHLDALLTNFVTLSLLLTLIALSERRAEAGTTGGRRMLPALIGSGVFAGLALLTKGPALILLPFSGLVLFALLPAQTLSGRLGRSIRLYLIWLATALATVGLLWPALWVSPATAIERYVFEIIGNGGRPNGDGQFFLGQAIGDPGPLFYPVASALRLTPLSMVGLLALVAAAAVGLATRRATVDAQERRQRLVLLVGAAFVAFWFLVMTLGPKKFDRYVLPAWPALEILAAAGLLALARWGALLWQRVRAGNGGVRYGAGLAIGGLLLFQALTLAWYHPYYLSYYNPLLGGGPAAQRNLLIGWGEGMDQVGAYLRSRPDIADGQVLAVLQQTLEPFVPVPVRHPATIDRGPANYAVVYLETIQRGAHSAVTARIRETVPLHTVTIHGIEYAWIHQLPRQYEQPLEAAFGPALHLRGYSLEPVPGRLVVTPAWDVRAAPGGDYLLFLHLLDAQGRRVAQIDVAPGGADFPPTDAWQAGQQIAVPIPVDLPADLPAGDYQLVLGLYDATNGARLALTAGPAADPAVAGPDALLLTTVALGN